MDRFNSREGAIETQTFCPESPGRGVRRGAGTAKWRTMEQADRGNRLARYGPKMDHIDHKSSETPVMNGRNVGKK
jgi:hypothetical protein